jgi:hypothetical protein
MLRKIILFAFVAIVYACQPEEPDTTILDDTVSSNLSGYLEFTNDSIATNIVGRPPIPLDNRWVIGDSSKLELKISKNLTSNPYNLKLIITTDKNDPNSPVINFTADFDRKIIPGSTYRLITNFILFGNNSFVPGTTGGEIEFNNNIGTFGFDFGTELEINIASSGQTYDGVNTQILVLNGECVFDNNKYSELKIGEFNIVIEGNKIIDTAIFQ